jgi:pilus assembly protein CpaE
METDITLKKAEEIIGKPVYWQIPNDSKVMIESRNNGVPLIQHAPKSKAQQSITGLAQTLTGRGQQSATAAKAKKWFWQTSS